MIKFKRAIGAFMVAALIPCIAAIVQSGGVPADLSSAALFVLFYSIYFSILLVFGFPTLYISIKLKWGGVFVPPAVGMVFGYVLAKTLYNPQTDQSVLLGFGMLCAFTAVVASLIYHYPWHRRLVKE